MKTNIKRLMSIMLAMSLILPTVFNGHQSVVYAEDDIKKEINQENTVETTDNDLLNTNQNIVSSESKKKEKNTKVTNANPPLDNNIVYVAQNNSGNATGDSAENAISFIDAMSNAKDGDTFIVVDEINLPENWKTPSCNITITGNDKETSILKMAQGSTSNGKNPSMTLSGNLTLDNLMLDVVENSSPYLSSMFVIVANGHKLLIESGVYTKEDTSKYSGKIFGGGFFSDITGNTYIENEGSLLVTDIYGGGCAGNVTGDTNVIVTGLGRKIYGCGLTIYKSSNTANVIGNVNININNAQLTSRPIIYGGGDASEADAIVTGNVQIYHGSVKDGGKNIYGAGYAYKGNAYVGGNVDITVSNYDMSNNNSTIYGGGYGDKEETSAGVKGNVNITYEKGNFGTIYGAGEEYADVYGKTNITLKNNTGTPVVYGGGQGNKTYQVKSHKELEINLLNSKVDLYTQGVNAKVDGLVSVNLLGGGAERTNNSVGCNLYNRMRSSNTNGSDKGEPSDDFRAIVNVLDGVNTITTINDFEDINIQKGTLLEHVRYYDGSGSSSDGPRELFNNVDNVKIQNGAGLDLLGDNEITGYFTSAGNLTTVAGTKLVTDGKITSSKGASYTSSDAQESYTKSYAFLQTKTDSDPIAKFDSTDNSYFVSDRNENLTGQVVREWYLNKNNTPTIHAENKTLTVGDKFDPLEGVTASDKEDGDITLTIENVIENTVDTSKVGTYTVIYKVTDSNGASATKTITVTVKAKEPANPNPGDNDKPTKPDNTHPDTDKSDTPQTGDNNNIEFYKSMAIISGLLIIILITVKKKKMFEDR